MMKRKQTILVAGLGRFGTALCEQLSALSQNIVAVDADSLDPVTTLRANTLIALAVKIGKTRLIDNTVLNTRNRP